MNDFNADGRVNIGSFKQIRWLMFRFCFVHRKWNVLSKLVVPRVMLSIRYILSELEEIEREDNFRLKRFKELKYKKQKGDDDTNNCCYCNKQPEKGDDFLCYVCEQDEEKKNQKQKSLCDVNNQSCIEAIGDKASCLSTSDQKRLGDLNAHLEKVISLTCQCKLDGSISPSVDRLIYVCEEVKGKLETDRTQTTEENEQALQTYKSCEEEVNARETQKASSETCKEPKEKQDDKEEDSLGYFETKYKETVKVMKFKNEDGTISEERQIVTIKMEKKHPHKPNAFGMSPCTKVKQIASITSEESKSHSVPKHPKETKSEEISSCMKKESTKSRSCVSDSGFREKRGDESNESSVLKYCEVRDATTEPDPPSTVSDICCFKKSPYETLSNESKISTKSIKNEPLKKDVSCECKTEVKSVGCDPVWKDIATSTTGLADSSEETEELCICVKESNTAEPPKKDKVSISQKSANSVKVFCDKKSDEVAKKQSSHTCSTYSQPTKDVSTTTSNIVLEVKSFKEKPSRIKSYSCFSPLPEERKSAAKIDKRPKPCCSDIISDKGLKPCCKIRVVSHQGGSQGKEQEFIIFGNILDAIKKVLVPTKSEESFIKSQEKSAAIKTSSNVSSRSKKSSIKSSICKTCEAASKVSSKNIQESQSFPQSNLKNVEKSISWCRPRSQSADSPGKATPKSQSSCTPRIDIIKCSVCESELSESLKSETTSVDAEDEEIISCEIDSCPFSGTTASSIMNSLDQDEDAYVCRSSKKPSIKPLESKCKLCHRAKTQCECYPSKDLKNEKVELPKTKCKICYPGEDPSNCKGQNKDSKIEPSKSKCKICHRDKTECECPLIIDIKDDSRKKIEPLKSNCKTFYPEEENQNKASKWSQTGHTQDVSQEQRYDIENLCPLCSKDQNSSGRQKSSNIPKTKSKSLCCGYGPSAGKEETDCTKCTETVVTKDASTLTRRSDRYDVRPLKLMKPVSKLTCTCQSDSCLTERSAKPAKRCSSCHADYYK